MFVPAGVAGDIAGNSWCRPGPWTLTNAIGGTIVRIDQGTSEIVATIEVGNSPNGIGVAEDGTVWFTTHAL